MKYNPFQIFNAPRRDEIEAWQKSRKSKETEKNNKAGKFKDSKKTSENSFSFSRLKNEKPLQEKISKTDDVFELQPIKRKHFGINSADTWQTTSSDSHEQNPGSVPPFHQDEGDDLFEIRQELARRQMISEPQNMQYGGFGRTERENERTWNPDLERNGQNNSIILDQNSRRVSDDYRRNEEARIAYYSNRILYFNRLFSFFFGSISKSFMFTIFVLAVFFPFYAGYLVRNSFRHINENSFRRVEERMISSRKPPAHKNSSQDRSNRSSQDRNNRREIILNNLAPQHPMPLQRRPRPARSNKPAQSNESNSDYSNFDRQVREIDKQMNSYFK